MPLSEEEAHLIAESIESMQQKQKAISEQLELLDEDDRIEPLNLASGPAEVKARAEKRKALNEEMTSNQNFLQSLYSYQRTGINPWTGQESHTDPKLETGHYDDGHSFGWKPPAQTDSWKTLTPPPGDLEQALDDAPAPDPKPEGPRTGLEDLLGPPLVPSMEIAGGRWKKPAVVGGLAACVALGGFLIANNQGGGHKAKTVAAVAPVSPGNKPASNTAAFPPNTVGDGCLAFTVFSDSTDVHLVANMASVPPGIYHVTMQTDGGPLSGSSTIGDGATFFDVPLHFNRFTNITGAQASGPGGPIDVAALQKLWPFALNQTSEQAKGCSGATLKPIASLAPPVAVASDPKPLVAPFLSGLAGDFRAGNADDADSKLDPVVLQIHTLAQCRATVSTFTDPTYAFSVTSIGDPQPFDYTSGGKTVTVPHVLAVGVVRTRNGQPSGLTVHVSIGADGTLHWFTSCEPGSN